MKSFEMATVETALKRLFQKKHFCICALDDIGDLVNTNPRRHPNYKWLRALHCVDYAEMPHEIRDALPQKVMECLRPDSLNFEAMAMAVTREGRDVTPIEDSYLDAEPKVSRLPWRRK